MAEQELGDDEESGWGPHEWDSTLNVMASVESAEKTDLLEIKVSRAVANLDLHQGTGLRRISNDLKKNFRRKKGRVEYHPGLGEHIADSVERAVRFATATGLSVYIEARDIFAGDSSVEVLPGYSTEGILGSWASLAKGKA